MDAESRLREASSPADFQAVGLACRDILIEFANAVFSVDYVEEGVTTPGQNDAKARIAIVLREFGGLGGDDELKGLTDALWGYVVRLQHDRRATREEAERTLFYTSAAVVEVILIVERATGNDYNLRTYGVYKCPMCGRTELEEDVIVDYEPDIGPVLAARYVFCPSCPWTSLHG